MLIGATQVFMNIQNVGEEPLLDGSTIRVPYEGVIFADPEDARRILMAEGVVLATKKSSPEAPHDEMIPKGGEGAIKLRMVVFR